MAAYVITLVEVTDAVGYEDYRPHVLATLEPYGGRFVARGGYIEVLEGDWQPSRGVIIEFDSVEKAQAWYHSPEYSKLAPIRQHNSVSRMFIVEGVSQ